jgi:hypothetical protein
MSFIGMTSTEVLNKYSYYFTAPIFLLILPNLEVYINNIGGLLGFSAFVAVVLMSGVQRLVLKVMKH